MAAITSRFVQLDPGSYPKSCTLSPDWICLGASRVAPEVLSGVQYSPKADVFSFGVVLWELVTQVRLPHLYPLLRACPSHLHPPRIQVCDKRKRADSKAWGTGTAFARLQQSSEVRLLGLPHARE